MFSHIMVPIDLRMPPSVAKAMKVAAEQAKLHGAKISLVHVTMEQIKEGKTWPKPEGATNLREYRIYRWSPDDGENPRIDTYYVDMDDCGPMVLDGLLWIKNNIDPTLISFAPIPRRLKAV